MKTMILICGCLMATSMAAAHESTTTRTSKSRYSNTDERFRHVRTSGRNEDPDSGMASPAGASRFSDMRDYDNSAVYSINDDPGFSSTAGVSEERVIRDEETEQSEDSTAVESSDSSTAPMASEDPEGTGETQTGRGFDDDMGATGATAPDGSGAAETREMSASRDLEITREVRRQIMKADDLSTRSQNLTVVTENGKVMLRGSVPSAAEKNRIEQMARSVKGVNNVDSSQISIR
jgi:osmotically-inducible protein OsmY